MQIPYNGITSGLFNNASEITNVVWQSLDSLLTSIVARLPFVVAGIILLLIFFGLARVVRFGFLATSKRTGLDERLRLLFGRLIVVSICVIGVFTALTVIVPTFGFGDLIAGLGFTTFIIGFATKDILNNLLSGVLILWQQPFRVGDQIFIDKIQGRVEFIGIRATSLRMDDGELVLIPNGEMYTSKLTIRGAGARRRMNLNFKVGFDADIDRVKSLARAALGETEGVVSEPPPNIYVTDLTADGVNITLNFWINTVDMRPRDVFDRAATAVMRALNNSGVEPYPPGEVIVRGSSIVTNGHGSLSSEEQTTN